MGGGKHCKSTWAACEKVMEHQGCSGHVAHELKLSLDALLKEDE